MGTFKAAALVPLLALLALHAIVAAHIHPPPPEVTDPLPASAKGTCHEKAMRLCPIDGTLMKYSGHIDCLVKRRRRLPAWCREYVDSMERCVDDMHEFCRDLRISETYACLDHHFAQLSWRCESSMVMAKFHEESGRDTSKYRRAWALEAEDNARTRDEDESEVDHRFFELDHADFDTDHPHDVTSEL